MTHTRVAGAPADEDAQETLKRVVAVYGFLSSLREEVRAHAHAGPSFTSLETATMPATKSGRPSWRPPRSSSSSSSSSERSFLF